MNQLTDTLVMVRPFGFGFNAQTATTNTFQHELNDTQKHIQQTALLEFNEMVELLENKGIKILILPSREDVLTPDSIFPNNWFSHHSGGKLVIYPMLAPNRRQERQVEQLTKLLKESNIPVTETLDLSQDEMSENYLEGTGSLVLERVQKVAFAMESPRTTKKELDEWCQKMDYEGVFFHAYDAKSFPVYHTNVTMNMGREFVVVCLESIKDQTERELVENNLHKLDKEIIEIKIDQMYQFCGNVLQVLSTKNESKIVMSESAFKGYEHKQIKQLEKYGELIVVDIPTIETVGGGSARCMLAEVYS